MVTSSTSPFGGHISIELLVHCIPRWKWTSKKKYLSISSISYWIRCLLYLFVHFHPYFYISTSVNIVNGPKQIPRTGLYVRKVKVDCCVIMYYTFQTMLELQTLILIYHVASLERVVVRTSCISDHIVELFRCLSPMTEKSAFFPDMSPLTGQKYYLDLLQSPWFQAHLQ